MQVRAVLKKHDIRAKKSFGQNFLVNEKVAERIVSFCNLSKDDTVLEIGPGLGILTRYLVKAAGWVIAVERDKKLSEYLNKELSEHKNMDVICEDILKFDLDSYFKERESAKQRGADSLPGFLKGKKIKVIGNLPYYITSPIIEYLINYRKYIDSAFIMVQREVAQRLCAGPGTKDYGSISCWIQFYAELKKIFTCKPGGFFPKPEIESTVLGINFLTYPAYDVDNEELLFKIIRAAFNQRRKTLLKALLNNPLLKEIGRLQLEQILIDVNILPSVRAETLFLADFVRLADRIDKILV